MHRRAGARPGTLRIWLLLGGFCTAPLTFGASPAAAAASFCLCDDADSYSNANANAKAERAEQKTQQKTQQKTPVASKRTEPPPAPPR